MNIFGHNIGLWGRRKIDQAPAQQGRSKDGGGDLTVRDEWTELQRQLHIDSDRKQLYTTFERMDLTDIVTMVADQYTEDACAVMPALGKRLSFECKNKEILDALLTMRKDLDLDQITYQIIRGMALKGDDFERTLYARGKGVVGLCYADPSKVDRVDNAAGRLKGFKQENRTFRETRKEEVSYPWDYVHFRNAGRDRSTNYGTSIFKPALRPWKQLIMAEDEQLLYRLNRRGDLDVHYVDIGTNDEIEGKKILRRYLKEQKKEEVMDPAGGTYDHQYKPRAKSDDMYLAIAQDSTTKIERLPGNPTAGDIQDIIYYLDKYFGSVRMPKETFGFQGDNSGSDQVDKKKKLTSQNIVYARAIARLQHSYKQGIHELAEIHLDLLATDPEDTRYDYLTAGNEIKVMMEPVSYLAEYERLDLMNLRMGVATAAASFGLTSPNVDMYEWTKHILIDVLQFGTSKTDELLTRVAHDATGMPPQQLDNGGGSGDDATGSGMPSQSTFGGKGPKGFSVTKEEVERLGNATGKLSEKDRALLDEVIRASPQLLAQIHRTELTFENEEASSRHHAARAKGYGGAPSEDDA